MTGAFTHLTAREVTTFNEGWEFKRGAFPTDPLNGSELWNHTKWQQVTLPHTWNNHDMQSGYNRFYQGEAYYRKQYDCPAELKGKRVFLRFEGVGSCAKVYVNKHLCVGTAQ